MELMVLETSHIAESHTIQNLATALKAVTDKWNITKKYIVPLRMLHQI